ncbi:unnamed protein product [Lampetra planeri]
MTRVRAAVVEPGGGSRGADGWSRSRVGDVEQGSGAVEITRSGWTEMKLWDEEGDEDEGEICDDLQNPSSALMISASFARALAHDDAGGDDDDDDAGDDDDDGDEIDSCATPPLAHSIPPPISLIGELIKDAEIAAMRSERRIFVRGLRVMSPARLRGGEVSGGDMERRREEDEDAMMWRRWEEEEL